METSMLPGFDQEGFTAFLQQRDEPSWLRDKRQAAWQEFSELPWPSRTNEEWMRTDIRLFKLSRYSLPYETNSSQPEAELPTGLLRANVDTAGHSVSRNSQVQQSELSEKWAGKGVIYCSLEQAAREYPDLVKRYLNRAFNPSYDRFAALHAACWSGGQFLYIPRGVSVDQPFHNIASMVDGASDLAHTLVVLEEGAEATMLYETASDSGEDGGLHCGAVELIVEPGAVLRYVNLQNWGHKVWHFAHQKALLNRDSSLQWTTAAMGGRVCKVNQQVGLIGAGANSQVNGVLFTQGTQHIDYQTLQHHIAPSCQSDFLYKSALQDKSRTVWRGMIKVDKAAQKTNGYQRNDNLLLSERCRADSIPGLEIEADDVRCTHGSTTGRVDEELIFYAMCRGFTRREAIRAIVTGFFQQIFDRVTIESVRDALGEAIARRVRDYE